MVNRYRGEVALMVEGRALPMRLTLGALAELEDAFSVENLPALGERFAAGRLSARDIARILAAGLRGAGGMLAVDEVAALPFDGGLNGAIAAAITLLDATFAPAGTAQQSRPPEPPAS
ncbi:gene transfer agent family protein [Bosea sp. CS1GBMeth4]|uniref:gene transfer agent family protein n=1 Tax=Bosea sp. CS1GBMeth4 TaxID=1892849 RepID=UPI00164621E1|nr:gene transfer agent family protein [Bosea sp. CS1GBMeth4]